MNRLVLSLKLSWAQRSINFINRILYTTFCKNCNQNEFKACFDSRFLFITTFVCDTIIATENEFNVVPKLYEEVGCTEKNSADDGKRYEK